MKITNTQTGLTAVNLVGCNHHGNSDMSNTPSSVSINLYQAIVTINGGSDLQHSCWRLSLIAPSKFFELK